jgi:hypothetical protein
LVGVVEFGDFLFKFHFVFVSDGFDFQLIVFLHPFDCIGAIFVGEFQCGLEFIQSLFVLFAIFLPFQFCVSLEVCEIFIDLLEFKLGVGKLYLKFFVLSIRDGITAVADGGFEGRFWVVGSINYFCYIGGKHYSAGFNKVYEFGQSFSSFPFGG